MVPRLRFLAAYLLFWLAFFAVLRGVFLVALAEQASTLSGATLLGTFSHGLRLDLSAAAYLCFPTYLLIALDALPRAGPWPARLVFPYTAIAIVTLALLAAADVGVFQGWARRIDASVLPYLAFPREVWASAAVVSRGLVIGLWIGLSAAAGAAAWRFLRPNFPPEPPPRLRGALALALGAGLLLVPARGGWQVVPINQSSAYFSPVRFANQAALNVAWNFFDSWRRGLDRRGNPYLVMPMDSARALLARARAASLATSAPVLNTPRPNILLIVWEGLSARALERLGGLPGITPGLSAIAADGLLFRRFYAAGDRTEKGMAALLAGAPTIPDAAILRVPSKAATLPLLSRELGEAGYQTAFYYGGEPGFGNLQVLATEGHFARVLTKGAFARRELRSKWGAHDGAVAGRLLRDLHDTREPFFAVWLTLSSHEPFDVPGPLRVTGKDSESRYLNSLAYTDRVLRETLRQAAREPWWWRTLVVIVADHSRPLERTDAGAPYKSAESWYHIPMVWTGGALARHGVSDALGGQTDLAPTLLAQLGLPGGERYPFGRDLFAASGEPFAFYGFESGFGLVTARGNLVWQRETAVDLPNSADLRLGQAILQLAYDDFLKR